LDYWINDGKWDITETFCVNNIKLIDL